MSGWAGLRRLGVLAALGAAIVAGPARAEAAAYQLREIAVAAAADNVCNLHTTDQINAPDHGKVLWFLEAHASRLGRLDLATGKVRTFDLPKVAPVAYTSRSMDFVPGTDAEQQGPCDLLVTADGTLWFNDQPANAIGYMRTRPPYAITLLTLPTPASLPMAFQLGADGKLYVEETAADKIARIDPATHAITEFALPEKHAGIIGGAGSKRDGAHWFLLMNSGKLLRFDYATGKMASFAIPAAHAAPFVIRAYDDGLWFSLFGADAIGHFDPRTKKFSMIPMPQANAAPIGIIQGSDGDLYTDLANADAIARIDRATGKVVAEYLLPTKKSFADECKVGPDGAIWAPEFMSGKLARLWLPSFGKDPGFPQRGK